MFKSNFTINNIENREVVRKIIDQRLSDLCNKSELEIRDAIFPGRRLRPTLLMLLSKDESAVDIEDVITVSVSIELAHRASIILDDLVDGDLERRKVTTYHIKHGSANTVLISHYIVATLLENIYQLKQLDFETKNRLVKMFIDSYLSMSVSESYDVFSINDNKLSPITFYESKILPKTTVLFALVCDSFSTLTKNRQSNIYSQIGRSIGELYQIHNDMYDDLVASMDERGAKDKWLVNFSFLKAIVLGLEVEDDVDVIKKYIYKEVNLREYTAIRKTISKKKYIDHASDLIRIKFDNLFEQINMLESCHSKEIFRQFADWLIQKNCWDHKEYVNAGY